MKKEKQSPWCNTPNCGFNFGHTGLCEGARLQAKRKEREDAKRAAPGERFIRMNDEYARLRQEHADMKALLERLTKGTSKPRSPMLAALESDARQLLAKIKGA